MPQQRSRPYSTRGFSAQFRAHIAREEQERLLESQHDEEDHADSDGLYPPNCCWTRDQRRPPPHADQYGIENCNVYKNILRIRRDIVNSIDDPYSLDQLKAPRMNILVVRPLVDAYYETQDLSIVYCLLVNRVQFIREQSFASHHQTVNLTRALLCELLAEKILRRYNERNPGPKGLLKLANILVAGFEPFQKAPEEVIENNSHAIHWATSGTDRKVERKLTALEVAIVSESKSFLASSACQKVVDAIYRGKIVYTPTSFVDILPDHWKRRPISLYDPRRAPLLNQYRLIVPRTRNFVEVCQFVILLVLYLAVMAGRESRSTVSYEIIELIFDIYAIGWVLDQGATVLEHGWQVYTQNLWSFLDVIFSAIFLAYFGLRMQAFTIEDEDMSRFYTQTALDVLSCGAPVLIPRLAFNVMSENMLFLSLRSMISDFLALTALAVWCFAGFLLSLKWLHNGIHQSITIGKWMIWIWFGLDGTGIQTSPDFHWFLGPVLMITFAFLGNTLFLTILVSMLSNTFSLIVGNSVQEIQFRRAVLTFEGVKSDAIFAYMPPFNILALFIMLPLKFMVSERVFHKVNVAAVRVLNLPTLLLISWFERRTLWITDRQKYRIPKRIDWKNPGGPRVASIGWWARTMSFWAISRFSVHGDIQAVFDIEPPQTVMDEIAEEDNFSHSEGIGKHILDDFHDQFDQNAAPSHKGSLSTDRGNRLSLPSTSRKRGRRDSKTSRTSDSLKKEFADSSEERHDQDDHPRGYRKLGRKERMDSIIDYGDTNHSTAEANARLHALEESMQRVESMLTQIINSMGESSDEGEQELEQEVQSGILK